MPSASFKEIAMQLHALDWGIIVLFLVLCFAVGAITSRRSGGNSASFFLAGRNVPWWIAGTSMVATTFAADTPLAVTELVAQKGIAGNWLWWNMVFGGILTVFFFARLWRRSGIMTDCEFAAIRYSGRPARFLRGFRAIYIGIGMNMIVIGWVNLAMVKILSVVFPDMTFFGIQSVDVPGFHFSAHLLAVGGLMLFVAVYASLSGLMGVSVTDAFQFMTAMAGCIVLAVFAVRHEQIGGLAGLQQKLPEWVFRFTPELQSGAAASAGQEVAGLLKMTLTAFVAYLGVQWWASWYPGSEPGGGGYVAQRMMSAKNEKHSLFATLWFNVAHFAVRPWPWIIVALCSLVMYPDLPYADKGQGFVKVMTAVLPSGLIGFLLAAFLAAYMSTIASQTVWGTSYIINDLFRPFIKPNADERYYLRASRITTFVLMVLGFLVTSKLDTISGAWKFMLSCSAGIGLVLLLRWFWWRINAWSEIAAMLAPYAVYPFLYDRVSYEAALMVIVAFSTVVWLAATFLTKPVDEEVLKVFYARVHPGGVGWRPIASKMPSVAPDRGYPALFVCWFFGCCLVLCMLFGVGSFLFGTFRQGLAFTIAAAISAGVIYFYIARTDFAAPEKQ